MAKMPMPRGTSFQPVQHLGAGLQFIRTAKIAVLRRSTGFQPIQARYGSPEGNIRYSQRLMSIPRARRNSPFGYHRQV
jgi:hypothetical protein